MLFQPGGLQRHKDLFFPRHRDQLEASSSVIDCLDHVGL